LTQTISEAAGNGEPFYTLTTKGLIPGLGQSCLPKYPAPLQPSIQFQGVSLSFWQTQFWPRPGPDQALTIFGTDRGDQIDQLSVVMVDMLTR
jgi:hypothetical protein